MYYFSVIHLIGYFISFEFALSIQIKEKYSEVFRGLITSYCTHKFEQKWKKTNKATLLPQRTSPSHKPTAAGVYTVKVVGKGLRYLRPD